MFHDKNCQVNPTSIFFESFLSVQEYPKKNFFVWSAYHQNPDEPKLAENAINLESSFLSNWWFYKNSGLIPSTSQSKRVDL